MYHFNATIKWAKQGTGVKELRWLNVFDNLYGMRTNSYDGYIKELHIYSDALELKCYLVDDPIKMEKWKTMYPDSWKEEQLKAIKAAIHSHIKHTEFVIKDITISDSSYS